MFYSHVTKETVLILQEFQQIRVWKGGHRTFKSTNHITDRKQSKKWKSLFRVIGLWDETFA